MVDTAGNVITDAKAITGAILQVTKPTPLTGSEKQWVERVKYRNAIEGLTLFEREGIAYASGLDNRNISEPREHDESSGDREDRRYGLSDNSTGVTGLQIKEQDEVFSLAIGEGLVTEPPEED
jgi:hypothetical protein